MKLSKNFDSEEFACHCGCGFDTVDSELIVLLQKLRDILEVPIHINSGCRCEKHNDSIGGTINSYHIEGMAADVRCSKQDELNMIALQLNHGVGIYETFTHLDVRDYKARW